MSEAASSEVLMDQWTIASRGSEGVVSVLIVSVVLSSFVPREWVGSQKFESHLEILLRDGCACGARVKFGLRNVHRAHLTDI